MCLKEQLIHTTCGSAFAVPTHIHVLCNEYKFSSMSQHRFLMLCYGARLSEPFVPYTQRYRIHIVASTPKISRTILIFKICMPIEDHQTAFSLEISHKLCYTHIRWNTYQHMHMVYAGFRLYDLNTFLFT